MVEVVRDVSVCCLHVCLRFFEDLGLCRLLVSVEVCACLAVQVFGILK